MCHALPVQIIDNGAWRSMETRSEEQSIHTCDLFSYSRYYSRYWFYDWLIFCRSKPNSTPRLINFISAFCFIIFVFFTFSTQYAEFSSPFSENTSCLNWCSVSQKWTCCQRKHNFNSNPKEILQVTKHDGTCTEDLAHYCFASNPDWNYCDKRE